MSEENIDLDFTDTINLEAKTVLGDSVATFRNSISFNGQTYMLGRLDDPYFGISESTLYTTVSGVNVIPTFPAQSIDSVVLAIAYDTLAKYGGEFASHSINIHPMSEKLSSFVLEGELDTLYSNEFFEFEPTVVGSIQITPNYQDSIRVFDPQTDSLVREVPHLRIPMDLNYWSEILMDTLNTQNDSAFQEAVKGLVLISDPSESSMIGLNLSGASDVLHSVIVYYRDSDTTQTSFSFELGVFRHNYFEHDYSGSMVESYIQPGSTQEMTFIQSMAGVNTVYDISEIDGFKDQIINFAQLDIVIAAESSDFNSTYPVRNIVASYYNNDNNLVLIEDVIVGLLRGTDNLEFVFGGNVLNQEESGMTLYKYSLNLTNHVINILNDEIDNRELILSSLLKQERSSRSILFGPKHEIFPAKLKLIISNP